MKVTLRLFMAVILTMAISIVAQSTTIEREVKSDNRRYTSDVLAGGVHTPVVWKDIFQADRRTNANDSICSPWIAIQYDQNVTSGDSLADTFEPLFRYAPSLFRLHIRGVLFNTAAANADTLWLNRARFETAMDTTLMRELLPDTSSSFVKDGNYNRADYGTWTFEDPMTTADSMAFVYPLRVFGGTYLRIWVVVNGTNDSADWFGGLEAPAGGR